MIFITPIALCAPCNRGFPFETATQELLRFCIKPFEESKGIRWGILLKGETELIGTLGYHQWVKAGGYRARVGYNLTAAHRRRGIMTEALTAVLRYGFETMRLNKVEACTDPNRASPSSRLLVVE